MNWLYFTLGGAAGCFISMLLGLHEPSAWFFGMGIVSVLIHEEIM